MSKFIFLLLFFFINKSNAGIPSQTQVRMLFQEAATDRKSCKTIIILLQGYNEKNNPLLAGYKASATMMMANYVFNPFRKLSNFTSGKSLLEKSIEADIGNIELRLLRFNIQTNAPSFLGYSGSIRKDKAFLINSISLIRDLKLRQFVIYFLVNSDFLTSFEKKFLI